MPQTNWITKRRALLAISVISVVAFVVWWYLFEHGHVGPPTIGRDTTWVDGPVLSNGYVDYFAAANQIRARDIGVGENAAIPLLRARGPINEEDDTLAARWKMLTGESLPDDVPRQNVWETVPYPESEELDEAMERSWTAAEFPEVSEWIDAHERSLTLAREAAAKDACWLPVVRAEGPRSPLDAHWSDAYSFSSFARCLVARAMRHLGEGRVEECQDDLIAVRRIGNLTGQSGSVGEGLVSARILRFPFTAENEMLRQGLTEAEINRFEQMLNQVPATGSMADSINTFERMVALSHAQGIHQSSREIFDIDRAMQDINEYFDHMNRVLADRDDGTSAVWIGELYDRLQSDSQRSQWQIRFGSRMRAMAIATELIDRLAPATNEIRTSHDSSRICTVMLQTGLAIEKYRIHKQRIPFALDELVPEYMPSVPTDALNAGKPVQYTQTHDGYELRSVGRDAEDTEDDIVLSIRK